MPRSGIAESKDKCMCNYARYYQFPPPGGLCNLHLHHQPITVPIPHHLNNSTCSQLRDFCQYNRWKIVSHCSLAYIYIYNEWDWTIFIWIKSYLHLFFQNYIVCRKYYKLLYLFIVLGHFSIGLLKFLFSF